MEGGLGCGRIADRVRPRAEFARGPSSPADRLRPRAEFARGPTSPAGRVRPRADFARGPTSPADRVRQRTEFTRIRSGWSFLWRGPVGFIAFIVFSDAMLNSPNSRHVRFVSPYVILHFGSTTHIPAYSKDIIWSFLIPCERIIRVLRRLLRPAWSLTLSHTVSVGRPGNEACPTRPDTCSIYILYPS